MKEFNWQQTAAKAAEGDMTAFEMLYKQTEHTVFFTCLKLIGNEHDAKDVMQETYIKAFEKLPELSDFSKFPAWLNRIAVNNCKMLFRRHKDDYLEDMPEQTAEFADEDTLTPEDYVYDAEKRRVVMDIIDTKLSEAQRQTVILYYFNEMSVTEIAAVMECPEGTVKYRLSAARDKIREAVLIHEKESGDRLHAVVPVPILTQILRKEAEETIVPKITLPKPKSSSPRQSGGGGGSMTNGGQTNMIKALQTKIIIGAAAAVIAGGGIAAAVALNKNADVTPADSTATTSAAETKNKSDTPSTDAAENPASSETDTEATEPADNGLFNEGHYIDVYDLYMYVPFEINADEGMIYVMELDSGAKIYFDHIEIPSYNRLNPDITYELEDVPEILHWSLISSMKKQFDIDSDSAFVPNITNEQTELLDTAFLHQTGKVDVMFGGTPAGELYYSMYCGALDMTSYGKTPLCWICYSDDGSALNELAGAVDITAEKLEWLDK